MIDKRYFVANRAIYYGDLLLSLAVLVTAYAFLIEVSGPAFIALYLVCVAALYRVAVFAHEICHRQRDERMKAFAVFWNLTGGALTLVPAMRFSKPHIAHHALGTFGTRDDPQYLLVRSDRKLAVFVLVLVPFIMPLYSLLLVVSASIAGLSAEEAVERYLERKGHPTGGIPDEEHKREITLYSRHALLLFLIYASLLPETLPLLYAVYVGAWWLSTLRIPLEHGMIRYLEQSDARDHVLDSFTIEAPLAAILQPLGLRFHTAHHMYPGVPYHKLGRLHRELKAKGDPDYCNSVVSFRRAVRGPERTPTVDGAAVE